MTATSAGSSSSLAAKGLDISLAALQRQDPYINNIVDVASQVALYTYNNRANEWEKTEVEGTLFIYTRLASPRHGFTIMNRLSMENLTEPITKDLDFQLQDPFLLYRNARLVIHGIWFYDKEDCQRIAQRMKFLTHQEQVQAQSQGGWLSPGGGGGGVSEGKPVDIIQMLTKARSEYDKEKSTSEPKEIGGSSVLYGNPNLIKPIPVKPNTQENEGSFSLASLFGSQHKHLASSKPEPVPSSSTFGMMPTAKVTRPPVARTLTYEDTLSTGRIESSKEASRDTAGPQKVCEDGGNQSQHCPAIQKLMQGQRGVLQTVSESPENRLYDNGVPLEHHHVYHQPQPHHHHHHHHHHQQQQQQQQQQQIHMDPIKRLFQSQPPVSVAPPCCPVPVAQTQLIPAHSVSVSHLQQNQPLIITRSQAESQHNCQLASSGTGTGFSSQMPGVVSPHELLQKLQIVQQEQSLASCDPPHLGPGLAPRFMGPSQNVADSSPVTVAQKAALQFQVISPQRIPATVTPIMLLSPSVFTQTKASAGMSTPGPLNPVPLKDQVRILSRNQLQATLLHLVQNDSSFLDTIYETYISQFANDSSSKY